jgi:maleylacetoacetate isomerase
MRLYSYFRSSAAYRVRIALNLKGLSAETLPVHLVRDGGQQHSPAYRSINPQGLVPALVVDGQTIAQSLAIIEYLDEVQPAPALLPGSALDRAQIRAFALAIACDIHPLNNLRVLQHLKREFAQDQAGTDAWSRGWIGTGFAALEQTVALRGGAFCFGDTPTLADIVLVPQMFNARRVQLDLTPYPTLQRIDAQCQALDAFAAAHPDRQPDA